MTSLIVGIVLIVGGIAFAAAPLLRRRTNAVQPLERERASTGAAEPPTASLENLAPSAAPPPVGAAGVAAALEELELDRAMGKMSAEDYVTLRAGLERRAELASAPSPAQQAQLAATPARPIPAPGDSVPRSPAPHTADTPEDRAERLVQALRTRVVACETCGPRPEPGARFCSTCGATLGGCPRCGHAIVQSDASFCDRCGTTLAR